MVSSTHLCGHECGSLDWHACRGHDLIPIHVCCRWSRCKGAEGGQHTAGTRHEPSRGARWHARALSSHTGPAAACPAALHDASAVRNAYTETLRIPPQHLSKRESPDCGSCEMPAAAVWAMACHRRATCHRKCHSAFDRQPCRRRAFHSISRAPCRHRARRHICILRSRRQHRCSRRHRRLCNRLPAMAMGRCSRSPAASSHCQVRADNLTALTVTPASI